MCYDTVFDWITKLGVQSEYQTETNRHEMHSNI